MKPGRRGGLLAAWPGWFVEQGRRNPDPARGLAEFVRATRLVAGERRLLLVVEEMRESRRRLEAILRHQGIPFAED